MFKHLKATFLASLGAAFFLTSCSSDETIGVVAAHPGERQEIEFSLDMMSRGTDRTIANLDTIWVYADDGAAEVFPATAFIKNEYGYFKPKSKIYWPDDKENLNFTAFWPSLERLNTDQCTTPNNKHQKMTFTPGAVTLTNEIPQYSNLGYDLITATKQMSKEDYKGTIALNFTHALTQVDFKVKQNPTADHRVEIYGFEFRQGPDNICDYSFKDGSWTFNNHPDSGLCKTNGAPDEMVRVGEEPVSIVSENAAIYLHPMTWIFSRYDLKQSTNKTSQLRLFAKIYDEEGNLIYPTEADMSNVDRATQASTISIFKSRFGADLTGTGQIYIQLGKEDITPEPGHKYVFNIDFTFGAGYYSSADKTSPYAPILKNPICADVTVEDWTSTELDDMEQN